MGEILVIISIARAVCQLVSLVDESLCFNMEEIKEVLFLESGPSFSLHNHRVEAVPFLLIKMKSIQHIIIAEPW